MLRNSIVRSTLTYGIQTLDLTDQDKQRMDGCAFYCLRQIHDIHWSQKTTKTTKREPAHTNATTYDRIADMETEAKACVHTNKKQLGYT